MPEVAGRLVLFVLKEKIVISFVIVQTICNCRNALPFNLVHFPKGEYPGKFTQREIISEEELSEHLDCLSE